MGRSIECGRHRVAIVGIDGFSPERIERCMDAGYMPHLTRIRSGGSCVPLLSTLPATTPVAWASIVTGCHPSVTGIEGFLLHQRGDRLDQRISGTYSNRCCVEPLWETATLWGKKSCVAKFPLSYPSVTAHLRFDGAAGWGGIKCLHEAASASVSDSAEQIPGGGRFLREVDPWHGEGDVPLAWHGRLELPTIWSGPPVEFAVGITDEPAPRVAIATAPDWSAVLVLLPLNGWSEQLFIDAHGRRGRAGCAVRFKVLDVALTPMPRVRLFNTPVHETSGHSHPVERAARHLTKVGPIEEQTDPSLCLAGFIDTNTQFERCRFNVEWLKRVSHSVLSDEDWDLFMVQVHIVDWAHHLLEGAIDARHPLYDPSRAHDAERLLCAHYQLADEIVGTVAGLLGSHDDIIVLGDHGQDLHHTTVRVNELLAQAGLLAWTAETSNGVDEAVDWSRTRVYAAGNYVYLNVAGREPSGIVEPTETRRLLDGVVNRLLALVDPRTGERPVLTAGPKADFAWLGADGIGVGDIVLCFASGYQARNDRGPIFSQTVPLKEFTSGHDHFWPPDPRIETRLYAAGPSFRKNHLASRRSVIDVAPTVCAALGIEPSPECQGTPIDEILAASRITSVNA